MLEVGTDSRMAQVMRQFGETARTLIGAICESRLNYWAAYAADLSCPCIFAYLGMQQPERWPVIVLSSMLGLLLFSLIEYAVHRWLLHDLRSVLTDLHDAHHANPERTSAFLFPTSFLLLMPAWFLLRWAHVAEASYFLMGLSGGYLYFDTLHHVEHTTRINRIPFRWLKRRWAFHSVHHRIDRCNYGVITPFWDHVFGTHQTRIKHRLLR